MSDDQSASGSASVTNYINNDMNHLGEDSVVVSERVSGGVSEGVSERVSEEVSERGSEGGSEEVSGDSVVQQQHNTEPQHHSLTPPFSDTDDPHSTTVPHTHTLTHTHPNPDPDPSTNSTSDSLLHEYSATTLANEFSTLQWKTYDSEMTFTVKHIPSTPVASLHYMNRFNEGAYEEACGKQYTLMMFPPDNSVLQYFPHLIAVHEVMGYSLQPKTGVAFRMEFFFMNHLMKSIRLKKIILLQEYDKLKEKIVIFKEFLILCNKKMDAQKYRLSLLENELVLYEPYLGFNPSSILGSFLSSAVGWGAFQSFFDKELKHLQNTTRDRIKAEQKAEAEAVKAAKKEAKKLKVAAVAQEGGGDDDSASVSTLGQSQGQSLVTAKKDEKSERGSVAGDGSGKSETESMIIEKILNRQGLGLSRAEMEHIWCFVRYWQVVNSGTYWNGNL
jgi:hypothetical protein